MPIPPEAAEAPAAPDGKRVERRIYRFSDDEGGKDVKHKRVIIVRDGEQVEIPDVKAIEASIPDIRSGRCDGDHGSTVVVTPGADGRKTKMVICVNRIEAQAAQARDLASHSTELAMAGLRGARASIAAERNLTEEQRKAALAGIDEAIRDLQNDKESDKDD